MTAPSRRIRVAVLGATGYGGGELLRLLLRHPNVDVVYATSRSQAGVPVSRIHRNLLGFSELAFSSPTEDELVANVDVAFGALPHAASAEALAPLYARGVKVVDLSGDFRLRDVADYEKWYAHKHPAPELLKAAVYGCPELHRAAIRHAHLVASPGCFATAINLALLPAAAAGWLTKTPEIVGMTGSSGSGAEAKDGTHHPTRAQTVRAYKVLSHQHTPEIVQTLREAGATIDGISFTPVSIPIVRGILVIATFAPHAAVGAAELHERYESFYAGHPFVRMPVDREPEPAAVATTNMAELRVRATKDGRVHVMCAIDNLVKGAAGQAIQSFNLMHGLDETTGLNWPGIWP